MDWLTADGGLRLAAVLRLPFRWPSFILPRAPSKPDNSEITLNDCHIWRYEKPDRQKKLCLSGGLFPRANRRTEFLEVPTTGGALVGICPGSPTLARVGPRATMGWLGQRGEHNATRRKRCKRGPSGGLAERNRPPPLIGITQDSPLTQDEAREIPQGAAERLFRQFDGLFWIACRRCGESLAAIRR